MKIKSPKLFLLLSLGVSALTGCGGENEYNVKTISFNTDGGTPIQDIMVAWGKTFTADQIPATTKEGHTLVNWYEDAQKTKAFTQAQIEENLTLYAKWSVNSYKVDYLDGDDTSKNLYPTATFNYGSNVNLPTPTKANVTFVGWYTSAQRDVASLVSGTYKMPATNITLYAGWSDNYYDVTFAENGDGVTGEMAKVRLAHGGDTILPANNFSRVGYTFSGWNTKADGTGTTYLNGGRIIEFPSAGPLVLYAQWKANTYKVNFYDYNEKLDALQKEGDYRAPLSIPSDAAYTRARAGFDFQGWGLLQATKDTAFNDSKLYFQVESGVATPLGFAQGKAAFEEGKPLYEATALPQGYLIQGETNLFAIYTRKTVAISFATEGGDAVGSVLGRYGENILLPTPIYAGHTFVGWYEEGATERYHGADMTVAVPTEPVTLHAKWLLNQYTISYITNTTPASFASKTLDYGAPLASALPGEEDISKAGYSLDGWYYDDDTKAKPTDTVPAKDITLSAKWNANHLTVVYHAGEGSGENVEAEKVFDAPGYASLSDIADLGFACEGHDFKGWNTKADGSGDDVLVLDAEDFAKASGTLDLYAQWTVNQYTVTYHSNDDATYIAPVKPDYGTPLNLQSLTKAGYRWDGWYYDAAFQQKVPENATVPAQNIDLYGKWTPKSLEVVYHANQGQGEVASTNHVYDKDEWSKLTEQRFTRDGYTFGGWNTKADGSGASVSALNVDQFTEVGGTLDLYAMWANNVLAIQYYGNGSTSGSMNESEHVYEVGTWSALPECGFAKQYHHFAGWKDGEGHDVTALTGADFKSGFDQGKKTISLYAQWAPNTIQVTYDDGDGEGAPATMTKTYGEDGYKTISSAVPTLLGHTFSHWEDGSGHTYEALTDADFAAHNGVIALHAVYTTNGYKINYVPGNGDEIHAVTVDYNSGISEANLPEIQRDGYDFDGWFYADNTKAKAGDLMPANDITLSAQWTAHRLGLTYSGNLSESGMTDLPEAQIHTFDETGYLTISELQPQVAGYTFLGWNTKADGSGETRTALKAEDFYGDSMNYLTLYAQWEQNTVRVSFNANDEAGSTRASGTPAAIDHVFKGQNWGKNYETELDDPVRYGYSFGGWYRNPECTGDAVTYLSTSDYSKVDGALTLYAKWTAKTLQVEYRKGVVESEEETVTNMPESVSKTFDGEDYAALTAVVPVREGFTFTGWYIAPYVSDDQYRCESLEDSYNVSGIVLYAGWAQNVYTVTYDSKGGTSVNTQNSYFGNTITLPTNVTRTGYTLEGWYYKNGPKQGQKAVNGDLMPSQNITLEAHWTVNTIALTYAANDATGSTQATGVPTGKIHVYGEEGYVAIATAEPTRPGYDFGGWYRDQACSSDKKVTTLTNDDFKEVDGELTLYAKWTAVTITIHYHGNGADQGYDDVDSARTFDGENWNVLTDAFAFVKLHYHRNGWLDAENHVVSELTAADFSDPDNRDLHLYVNWEGNTATITYLSNNGTDESLVRVVRFGEENYRQLAANDTFSKEGHSFVSWYRNEYGNYEQLDDSLFNIDGNTLTLQATWTVNQYGLTYIYDNGQEDFLAQITYASALGSFLSDPAKTGYQFVKWVYASGPKKDQDVATMDHMPAENISIRAVWETAANDLYIRVNLEDPAALGTYRQNYEENPYLGVYKTEEEVPYADLVDGIVAHFPNFELASVVPETIVMAPEGNVYSIDVKLVRRTVTIMRGEDQLASYAVAHGTHVLHDNALEAALATLVPSGHTARFYVGTQRYALYTDIVPESDLVVEVVDEVNTNALIANAGGGTFASNSQGTREYGEFAYGTSFGEVEEPTYLGYTFAGWYLDLNHENPATTMGDEQTTIYAKWTANTISLVYDANLGSGAPEGVSKTFAQSGYAVISETSPSREGYTFAGWFRDAEGTGAEVKALADTDFASNGATVTLYAKWTIHQHYISYASEGGTLVDDTDLLDYGTVIGESRLPDIAKQGYVFDGWFYQNGPKAGQKASKNDTLPDVDVVLVAHWTAKTLKVIYHLNDGSETTDTVDLTYGEAGYDAPSTTVFNRTGHTFAAWYGNPEKTGDAIGDLVGKYVNAANTIDLYAKWDANTLTIRFFRNGGTGEMENVVKTYGQDGYTSIPNNGFSRTGYHFTAWYRGQTSEEVTGFGDADYASASNSVDLYAGWEANVYELAYESGVGAAVATKEVAYEANIGAASLPELAKDGYTFDGWYLDAQRLNQATAQTKMALGGMTLYAKWTAHTLTIIYDGNGATGGSQESSERTYDVNSEAWKNLPGTSGFTKTNYHFTGWKVQGGDAIAELSVDHFAAATGELHLVAQWAGNTINLIYDTNGKEATGMPATATPTFGQSGYAAIAEDNPSFAKYRFDGWYRNANGTGARVTALADTDFATNGADLTLYAKWTEYSVQVVYNGNGEGAENVPASVERFYGTENYFVIPTSEASRTKYRFDGWYRNAQGTGAKVTALTDDDFTGVGGSLTLYAKWTAYSLALSYDLNGGSGDIVDAPHVYGADGYTALNGTAPSRAGYEWDGWYRDLEDENSKVTALSDSDFTQVGGALTLYAKWTAHSIIVIYRGNEANSGSVGQQTKTYDDDPENLSWMSLKNNENGFVKTGHHFVGWNTKADGTGVAFALDGLATALAYADYFASQRDEPLELFAQWLPNTLTINYKINDGSAVAPVQVILTYGQSGYTAVAANNTFAPEGYDFGGWFLDMECSENKQVTEFGDSDYVKAADTIDLYAKWTAHVYQVSYDSNGGVSQNTVERAYLSDLNLPAMNRTGYVFDGWFYENGTKAESTDKMPARNVVLTAHWTAKQVTIVYVGGEDTTGTTVQAARVYNESNSAWQQLAENGFSKTGYYWAGWKLANGTPKSSVTLEDLEEDEITLYAVWEARIVKINYQGNGATTVLAQTTHTYGQGTYLGEIACGFENPGSHFTGWTLGAEDGPAFAGLADDVYSVEGPEGRTITLYAHWEVNTVMVKYHANSGTGEAMEDSVHTYNSNVGIWTLSSNEYAKTYYHFAGWYRDAECTGDPVSVLLIDDFVFDDIETASETLNLYAKWERNNAIIVYNGNGADGSEIPNVVKTYGEEGYTTIPQPSGLTRTGYEFAGWYTSATDGESLTALTDDDFLVNGTSVLLYAHWNIQSYTLSYNTNGGDEVASVTVEYNQALGASRLPTSVTKLGYTLVGWYLDENFQQEAYSVTTMPAHDTTLYAKWVSSKPMVYYAEGVALYNAGEVRLDSDFHDYVKGLYAQAYSFDFIYHALGNAANGNQVDLGSIMAYVGTGGGSAQVVISALMSQAVPALADSLVSAFFKANGDREKFISMMVMGLNASIEEETALFLLSTFNQVSGDWQSFISAMLQTTVDQATADEMALNYVTADGDLADFVAIKVMNLLGGLDASTAMALYESYANFTPSDPENKNQEFAYSLVVGGQASSAEQAQSLTTLAATVAGVLAAYDASDGSAEDFAAKFVAIGGDPDMAPSIYMLFAAHSNISGQISDGYEGISQIKQIIGVYEATGGVKADFVAALTPVVGAEAASSLYDLFDAWNNMSYMQSYYARMVPALAALPLSEYSEYYAVVCAARNQATLNAALSLTSESKQASMNAYLAYEESAFDPISKKEGHYFDSWRLTETETEVQRTAVWVYKLDQVTGLSQTHTSNSVTFHWDSTKDDSEQSDANVWGYQITIYRKSQLWKEINQAGVDNCSYTVDHLEEGEKIDIKIVALFKGNDGSIRLTSYPRHETSLIDNRSLDVPAYPLSSDPVTYTYINREAAAIDYDHVTAGDYFYVEDRGNNVKDLYLFSECTYTFPGKTIVSSDPSVATVSGDKLTVSSKLPKDGTITITIGGTDYVAHVNPLLNDIDLGKSIKSYQSATVDPKATLKTDHEVYYGESATKTALTVGTAKANVAASSSYRHSDYIAQIGGDTYYNGVKLDVVAKSTTGATIDNANFLYDVQIAGWTAGTDYIYDTETTALYLLKTGTAVITVKPQATNNVYVPNAYLKNGGADTYAQTYTVNVVDGFNVYSHEALRHAYADTTLATINVLADIEVEYAATMVPYVDYVVSTGYLVSDILLKEDSGPYHGDVDIEDNTAVMKPVYEGYKGPKYKRLETAEDMAAASYKFQAKLDGSDGIYFAYDANGDYYIDHGARWISRPSDGHFKIMNLHATMTHITTFLDSYGLEFGFIYNRYNRKDAPITELTINGNYYTIDASGLPFVYSTYKVKPGSDWTVEYNIQNIQNAVFANYGYDLEATATSNKSNINFNNFTLRGNTVNTSKYYSGTDDNLKKDMEQHSGGICGFAVRPWGAIYASEPEGVTDSTSPNYQEASAAVSGGYHYNDATAKMTFNGVNIYETLIGVHASTYADLHYVRIDNTWANSLFAHCAYGDAVINIDHTLIGSSGGASVDVEDQLYMADPTVNIDYTNTVIDNRVSGEEPWFKGYNMEVTALALKSNFEQIVRGVTAQMVANKQLPCVYTLLQPSEDTVIETEVMNYAFFARIEKGNSSNADYIKVLGIRDGEKVNQNFIVVNLPASEATGGVESTFLFSKTGGKSYYYYNLIVSGMGIVYGMVEIYPVV